MIAAFSLVMVGNGLLLTLLGVRSTRAGFGGWTTGAVLGGYYVGFLAGARNAPNLLRRFGVTRGLALLAATMAVISASPAIAEVPLWWVALRIMQGFAISASYVLMEAFLNSAVDDRRRGRLLGTYMIVTMTAFAAGAFAYRFTGADGSLPFVIAGALTAAGAAGIGLSNPRTGTAVTHPDPQHVTLAELFRAAPIGITIGALVGAANGALSSVSVFAERAALDDTKTAILSAAGALGPIALLYPLSAASDRIPRRHVIAAAAGSAAVLMLVASRLPVAGSLLPATMFVAGGLTVTLYTLTSAETNDRARAEHLAAVGSYVILLYGIGAIVGTLAATVLVAVARDDYFYVNAAPHVAIVAVVAIYSRRSGRPTPSSSVSSSASSSVSSSAVPIGLARSGDQWTSTLRNCHGSSGSMSSGNNPERPTSGFQSV